MDYTDFTVFQTTKRLKSRAESDELWLAMLRDPNQKKEMKGVDKDGQPMYRLEIEKGDYSAEQQTLEYTRRLQCEESRVRKPTEQVTDNLFEQITSGHMALNDEYFQSFQDGNLTDEYEPPLALLDKTGRAVVKLGPESLGDEKAEQRSAGSGGSGAGSKGGDMAKQLMQAASAKTSAMASLKAMYLEEQTVLIFESVIQCFRSLRVVVLSGCLGLRSGWGK